MSYFQEKGETTPEAWDDFHLLIDNINDCAIFTTDLDGRITYWNPGAVHLLGYAPQERLGQPFSELFTEEDQNAGMPQRELETARQRGNSEDERWHVRKDGSTFFATGTLTTIQDPSGKMRGFVKVLRDITVRKHLEQALAASEARFRSIAEQSPVLIWRSDLAGQIDYFNPPWYVFRGRTPPEELGSGWIEGIHPADRDACVETARAAIERREPFEVTIRVLRHDGRYRWVINRGTPYDDGAGNLIGYLGSCVDITDRIELEKALQQQRTLAEEATQRKSRLMSALSHDARTPLNAVVLATQLLELNLGEKVEGEVQENLRTIRNAVGNVLDLLSDLLDVSRLDAGAVTVEPSRFALEPAVVECLSGIAPQAQIKDLDLQMELGELTDAVLETDRPKLKQILCNLLSNALRFTQRGHIRVFGRLGVDQIHLGVEDTGIGISPEDQRRVFDEFAMLDHPHRPIGEGTGLGLAICRRLANLLGGEISLWSELNRGSIFSLSLPATLLVVSGTQEEHQDQIPKERSESTDVDRGLIVVAEDHLASRQALSKLLRRMGYRVREASNGHDALALAREELPLIIFMDVNMPVMDGIEATRILRSDPATSDVTIIALTGDVTIVNQRRISEAGATRSLEKPVNSEMLKSVLQPLQEPDA